MKSGVSVSRLKRQKRPLCPYCNKEMELEYIRFLGGFCCPRWYDGCKLACSPAEKQGFKYFRGATQL